MRSDGSSQVSVLVLPLILGLSSQAAAQAPATPEQAKPEQSAEQAEAYKVKEEVTVTGTLIPREDLTSLSPVATISVEEVTYQGTSRVEDLIQQLPQAFAAQNSTISNGASGTATRLAAQPGLGPHAGPDQRAPDGVRRRLRDVRRPELHPLGPRQPRRRPHRGRLVRVRRRRRGGRRQLRPRHRVRGLPGRGDVERLPAQQQQPARTGHQLGPRLHRPHRQRLGPGGLQLQLRGRRQVRREQGPRLRLRRLPGRRRYHEGRA